MQMTPLLDELRAGEYLFAGSTTGGHGNGHNISYQTKKTKIYITFMGGLFYYDIQLKYPPAHGAKGGYSEPHSPRKMYQQQIVEAMQEGAKHHAHIR